MARKIRKSRNDAAVYEREAETTEQIVIAETGAEQTVIETGAPEALEPTTADAPALVQPVITPEQAPPAKRRGRPPKAKAEQVATPTENGAHATLGDLCEAWLKHLEAIGKSRGTVFGYSIDLAIALKHFGTEVPAATLTTRKVQNYFDSEAVTLTRSGRAKAKPTIDKTRRAFRLALTWAAEAGLIATAPLPETQA